jgi:putative membrane protein
MFFPGMHGFGMIFWLILFCVLVWLVIKMLSSSDKKISAREMLDERYAKGELSSDEYQRMKNELNDRYG